LTEDHYPVLEDEAPKAFFLGSVASVTRSHDEREMPAQGKALYLMSYLNERQEPLSLEELKDFTTFRRAYGANKVLKGAVNEWIRRFPKDREAAWALAQTQKADGQFESTMATLMPLLTDEPDNPDYLGMAADVELSLYVSQRSYLNHVSNERTLAFLERLLAADVNDRARVYRKISQVYAVDRDYVTALRYLEQAAESNAQGGKHDADADALWVEAAQMAIEIEDFGKAHGYLLKALVQNPLNPTARHLSRELPMLSLLPF